MGGHALELMYKDVAEQDGTIEAEDGRMLLACRWLLTDEQNAFVLATMKDVVRSGRALLIAKAISADSSEHGAAASSSSSSSISTAIVLKVFKPTEAVMTQKEVVKSAADMEARKRLRDVLRGKIS